MATAPAHAGPVRKILGSSWLSLLVGIGLIVLGLVVLFGLYVLTISLALLVGIALVVAGILQGLSVLKRDEPAGSRVLDILLSAAAIIGGVYLLVNPLAGPAVVTLVLAIFFPVEGIAKISAALKMRDLDRWEWILASGIVSLLLGVIIWFTGLSAATQNTGLLLGADLILTGIAVVVASR